MPPRPRQPAGRFLGPTGLRHSPMRQLETHPLAEYDDERRIEVERIAAATSIRDEPECIGPAILDDYASVALLHRSQQHALDVANARELRPTLTPDARLKDLRRRAKHGNVDLSHEIHILDRDITKARDRGQPAPPRVHDRLQRLELLLDGIAA